jgi:hypothetical protein
MASIFQQTYSSRFGNSRLTDHNGNSARDLAVDLKIFYRWGKDKIMNTEPFDELEPLEIDFQL